MMLNDITTAAGRHKRRKRVGRGESSGHGKTCGRGNKGCQARSGGGVRPLTEGGQMPTFRRLPKRGFSNFNFRTEYHVVNVADLEKHFADGATVDVEALRRAGLVRGTDPVVKLLGDGKLSRKLTVSVHAVSATARAAVEQAGGSVNLIPRRNPAVLARLKRNAAKRAARTGSSAGSGQPGR